MQVDLVAGGDERAGRGQHRGHDQGGGLVRARPGDVQQDVFLGGEQVVTPEPPQPQPDVVAGHRRLRGQRGPQGQGPAPGTRAAHVAVVAAARARRCHVAEAGEQRRVATRPRHRPGQRGSAAQERHGRRPGKHPGRAIAQHRTSRSVSRCAVQKIGREPAGPAAAVEAARRRPAWVIARSIGHSASGTTPCGRRRRAPGQPPHRRHDGGAARCRHDQWRPRPAERRAPGPSP